MADYVRLCEEHTMTTDSDFYLDDIECPWCIATALRQQRTEAKEELIRETERADINLMLRAKVETRLQNEVEQAEAQLTEARAEIDRLKITDTVITCLCGQEIEVPNDIVCPKCEELEQENHSIVARCDAWLKCEEEMRAKLLNAENLEQENKRLRERFVITGCVFHGNAPFPNENWQEWADRPEITGVRIEALKEVE